MNNEFNNNPEKENTPHPDIIIGRNPVMEAVRSGRNIDKLLVASGTLGGSVAAIIAKATKRGIVIKEVPQKKLDFLAGGGNHQGIAAFVSTHEYCSIDDIFALAEERNEKPFIIICDELEDPHNLGAIIRTAEACAVHGIIIPKRRSVSLNSTVAKSASGALEYMKVAKVTNLISAIDELKSRGVWIYGADMEGSSWVGEDFSGPTALVIGSEGRGISRLVGEHCDVMVSLPMQGEINSLNASVAAGILMYEVARQRAGIPARNK